MRVFDWLDHLGVAASVHDYLGKSSAGSSDIVHAPVDTVVAEWKLRRLPRRLTSASVLISRQASPFSNGSIEEKLLDRASHGVYDFDDALFAYPERSGTFLWSKRSTWKRSVQAADAVIAGNEYLAQHAAAYSSNVVVIPSCIEPAHYRVKTTYELSDRPRAVWLGSPSTERFLQQIADPLIDAHRKFGLRLTVISAGQNPLGPLDVMVDRIRWDPKTMPHVLAESDFGVMPLSDTPWARGKCAYKLLQYGASALPMIGSPVGANSAVLTGCEAPAPESEDDWTAAIENILSTGTANRRSLGTRAREFIVQNYSFSAWATTWTATVLANS